MTDCSRGQGAPFIISGPPVTFSPRSSSGSSSTSLPVTSLQLCCASPKSWIFYFLCVWILGFAPVSDKHRPLFYWLLLLLLSDIIIFWGKFRLYVLFSAAFTPVSISRSSSVFNQRFFSQTNQNKTNLFITCNAFEPNPPVCRVNVTWFPNVSTPTLLSLGFNVYLLTRQKPSHQFFFFQHLRIFFFIFSGFMHKPIMHMKKQPDGNSGY